MSLISIVLWLAGIALVALAYIQGRGPWSRYQALRDQDANAARYAAWRGGIRDDSPTTGASVAMQVLRRQWQQWAAVGIVGIVLIVVGFVVR
jgi:hypothetical protein